VKTISSFGWAAVKLKEFNGIVTNNSKFRDIFVAGEYDFLQVYQVPIFFELVSFFEKNSSGQKSVKNDVGIDEVDKNKNKTAKAAIHLRQLSALIISLFSYLVLVMSRRNVLIYTADKDTYPGFVCDFRVTNLFRYLLQNQIRFFEIFHTVFGKSFFNFGIRRKRFAVYLETIDFMYAILYRIGFCRNTKENRLQVVPADLERISDLDNTHQLFQDLLIKYSKLVNRSQFRIHFLLRFLKYTAIKVLIAPADTRNYCELVAACNLNNIQTHGFQSGNISKYNVGLLRSYHSEGRIIKPMRMHTESGYWRSELIRLGTYFDKHEIEVGGNLKEDYSPTNSTQSRKRGEDLIILIPYEIAAPKEEILEYIKKFLSFPNVRVVFKMRADRDLSSQAQEYGLQGFSQNLILTSDLVEIDHFDIVVGTYSTFLYEMIGRLKPVGVLKTSLDYGEGLVINQLAETIDINDQYIFENLKRLGNIDSNILENRQKILYSDTIPLNLVLDNVLNDIL